MNLKSYIRSQIFKTIGKSAAELDTEVYAIGGMVRDILLKRPNKDYDFVTDGDGIQLAERVAEKLGVKKVNVFKNFGTAQFKFNDLDLEFVGARKESYNQSSRKPHVAPGSLSDDQKRRDFTINALAISLQEKNFGDLIDPFDGFSDLNAKIIRTPLDADITFSDDPLRMFRAIRFAAQLGFSIEKESYEAIKRNAHRIDILSGERIIAEVNKMILTKRPSKGFRMMFDTGLLQRFFPELVKLHGIEKIEGISHKDNFYHTLQVLDNLAETSDDLWLRWGAIMHDIAKPPTKRFEPGIGWTFHGHEDLGARMVPKIFSRLKLPLDHQMKYVQKMVQLHLRPIALTKEEITDSAIRRLLFEAGDDIDDLMLLCKADITSKNEAKVKKYLNNYELVKIKLDEVEKKDHIRNFQPPITGELIMSTFGLAPGKEVGIIKNAIKDAILDGIIHNDFDEAFRYMLEQADKIGLQKV
ncbi:MAG: CCA tRNA nucleotidyltransferase [Flavobacteriales bacterium]